MMISFVANVINLFATTLQNVLLLASFTGKLIVSVVTWILSFLFNIINSIVTFFQIVYEDNLTIFTEDIPASANGVFDAIQMQLFYLQNAVVELYQDIYLKFSAGLATIDCLVHTVFMSCGNVLILLRNVFIFVGDTVWLIVTFIPIHVAQLLRAASKYIGNILIKSIIDGYMSLLKLTNYLTEVPLQSFMGITSAIVIVRLCIHFRTTILTQFVLLYWSLIRNILYIYYVLVNYFTNSEVAVIAQIANSEDVGARDVNFESSSVDDSANAADSLCVICQERQKCVLTLPCRHVCLCADCCRRLYGYQRTCPICRTFIYHSVTVYL